MNDCQFLRFFYAFLILLFVSGNAVCQDAIAPFEKHPNYIRFGVEDGLPGSTIFGVVSDDLGYIWLATEFGVCRYNGSGFDHFRKEDGLENNVVYCLTKDNRGRVWASSQDGSICYFENDRFHAIAANDSLKKFVQGFGAVINNIEFDQWDTLWLGTSTTLLKVAPANNYEKLLFDYSFSDSAVVVVKQLKNSTIESQYWNTIGKVRREKDRVWLWTQISSADSGSVNIPISLASNVIAFPRSVSMLLQDGSMLFSYVNHLLLYSASKELQQWEFNGNVLAVYQDAASNIYVSVSGEGVYFYPKGDLDAKPQHWFAGNSMGSICEDYQGGMWFSSVQDGAYLVPDVNHLVLNNKPFDKVIARLGSSGNWIYGIRGDGLVFKINADFDSVVYLRQLNSKSSFEHGAFFEKNNKLYISSNITLEVDLETDEVQSMISKGAITFTNSITGFNDSLLLSCASRELMIWENGSWNLLAKTPGRTTCLASDDANDLIYVGTRTGLWMYKDSIFSRVLFSSDSTEYVTNLIFDSNKRLIIGTKNSGVFIKEGGKIVVVDERNGLAGNCCNQLLMDDANRLWVATNRGVSFFELTWPSVVSTVNLSGGRTEHEVKSICLTGNQLVVHSQGSVLAMSLDEINKNLVPPHIYLSSVEVNGVKTEANLFSHNESDFRFNIHLLNYRSGGFIEYAYRLRGFDEGYKITQHEYVDFSNLPPGVYTFEAFAVRQNQPVGEGQSFKFEIKAPYWDTIWFYVLLGLIIGILIILFMILRIRNIRKQEKRKRDIDVMVAENKALAIRAQMNPHFIFNAINSIQQYVLHNKTDDAYDYLSKFARLIRLVMNNSRENEISITEEIKWLQIYVELEQLRFDNRFVFELDLSGVDDEEQELKIPSMIIQPIVENAIWHGLMPLKEHQGILKLKIEMTQNLLTIVVEDNGVGRKRSAEIRGDLKRKSVGVQLVLEKLNLYEKLHHKTARLVLEDLFDRSQPTGTRVKIEFEMD